LEGEKWMPLVYHQQNFSMKLGYGTIAVIQKATLPACPGRTDKVITRGGLLEAPADNKSEGM